MTLLNIISIIATIVIVVVLALSYRQLKKRIDDAEGLGDVNTRGPAGSQEKGDVIASFGSSAADENDKTGKVNKSNKAD